MNTDQENFEEQPDELSELFRKFVESFPDPKKNPDLVDSFMDELRRHLEERAEEENPSPPPDEETEPP